MAWTTRYSAEVQKAFFDNIGRKGPKNNPTSKCKLCSDEIPRPNYGNSGLFSHLNRRHVAELHEFLAKMEEETKKQQEGMQKYASVKKREAPADPQSALDPVVLAWAKNLWSFNSFASREFQDAFSASIPPGASPKTLAPRTRELCREKMDSALEKHRGKDASLLFDAGTVQGRRWLAFCVAVGGECLFLKGARVFSLTTEATVEEVGKVVAELAAREVYVCALVADNAKAFQNALEFFDNENSGEEHDACEEESDAGGEAWQAGAEPEDPQPAEDDGEGPVEAAAEAFEGSGIFRVRCAAHSTQLILKDVERAVGFVGDSTARLKTLLKTYSGSAAREDRLRNLQIANGVQDPLVLSRPGETRWNSTLDCLWRCLKLQVHIENDPAGCPVPAECWSDFRRTLALCEPIGVATDRLQKETSTVWDTLTERKSIRTHLEGLREVPGMQEAAKTAADLVGKRAALHFNDHVYKAVAYLRPSTNQLATFTPEEREEMAAFLEKSAAAWCARRKSALNLPSFRSQLGKFVTRCEVSEDSATEAMVTFWEQKLSYWTDLAGFAMMLAQIAATEAAAERTFSKMKLTLAENRGRLADATLEAQLCLNVNFCSKSKKPPLSQLQKRRKKAEAAADNERQQAAAAGPFNPAAEGFVIVGGVAGDA